MRRFLALSERNRARRASGSNPKNGWALLGLEKARRLQGNTDGLGDLVRQRKLAWKHADVTPTSSCYCEPGAVELGR